MYDNTKIDLRNMDNMDLEMDLEIYNENFKFLPDILQEQLKLCGYTNTFSIYTSSDDWIVKMEEFIKKRLAGKSVNILQKYGGELCSTADDFEFLPGHINLLENMKTNILKHMKKVNNSDKNKPSSNRVNLLEQNTSLDQKNQKLKVEKQVCNFLKSKRLLNTPPHIEITPCVNKKGNATYSGYVSCVICEKKVNIHFDVYNRSTKRWIISNYTHHIVEHLEGKAAVSVQNKKGSKHMGQKSVTYYFSTMHESKGPIEDDNRLNNNDETENSSLSIDNSFSSVKVLKTNNDLEPLESNKDISNEEEYLVSSNEDEPDMGEVTEIAINRGQSAISNKNKPSQTSRYKLYTRSYRNKMKLYKAGAQENQRLITEFFEKVSVFISQCKTSDVRVPFEHFTQNIFQHNENDCSDKSSILLKYLLKLSTKIKGNNGDRFDETVKQVSAYLFMIGGRRAYEILQANLPLPSTSTVSRYLTTARIRMNEGEIRILQLCEYLTKRQSSKIVWLCEDATRIIDRVEYDRVTNTLVGLVPPIINGIPVCNYYQANNAKEIEQHILEGTTSKYAYTVMVQPLQAKTPPFCLLLYGTDNHFKADDVINRWQFIKSACAENGITILGMSGDGDSRILKSMEILSRLGEKNEELGSSFFMPFENETVYIQDTVHVANKLRNRLFNKKKKLKLGTFDIDMDHLKTLTKIVPRDQHFLREQDFDGKDRMNFEGVTRISKEAIQNLLEEHVPNSQGTQIYLQCIRFCREAFLSKISTPLERLEKIWFVVFLFRMWRFWILNTAGFSLGNNFISRNAYICVELNAHALALLILKKFDNNVQQPEFLSELFSSQPCEQFFRTLRSMTSTYSTVVNFSMLEILYRIGRVDLQESLNIELSGEGISLPRFDKERLLESDSSWPNIDKDSVIFTIMQAEHKALEFALSIGLAVNGEFGTDFQCKIPVVLEQDSDDDDLNEDNEDENIEVAHHFDEEMDNEELKKLKTINSINLTTFNNKEGSDYVEVQVENKAPIKIKKSSLVWLLRKENKRVSSDRLERFKN